MTFDFESRDPAVLRATGGVKWQAYDEDVVPMWVAETDFPTAPVVQEALRDAVAREAYGYAASTFEPELAEATAAWSAARYGWAVDPKRVHAIGDVLSGVTLAIQHYTRAGSAVVLPVPSYMPFFEVIPDAARAIVEVPMLEADGRWTLDLDAIEAAFRAGAGSLLLSNPFNPLGRAFTAAELTAVTDLAARYGARVIADEIHAPLVYDGAHVPVASVSDTAAEVTVTLLASSKAFNLPGLKCAQFVLANDHDEAVWQTVPRLKTHGASTLGIIASTAAYRDGAAWLDELLPVLRARRDRLVSRLRAEAPKLRLTDPEATYLTWLDFSGYDLGGQEPHEFLLEHARVAVNPGVAFGTGGTGHARLNFATTEQILEEGITRIVAALDGR